ncbi:hypothetical protein CK203_056497 [Vitis vinifera]|uniref:Retrotransposon gag domain-containing protein n=1 Tax=Vitis vinifera TaxID=29760 RepID=A0A438GEK6_VITVI|nr:hypothetical protein CK203_056497 [Vitis vinifera]
MCGGDDHLAWKRPVSLEACRGLRTAGGMDSQPSRHVVLEDTPSDIVTPPVIPVQMPATQTLPIVSHDHVVVVPPIVTPVTIVEDPRSRMDRLERRIGQMRDPDEMIPWDDLGDVQVATLPVGFRMPDIERYTGVGCPRIHLRLYSTVMRALGLDEAQLLTLFPLSLSGVTQRWFARHLTGVPFQDSRSLVQALFDVDDGISRGLWSDIIPSPDTEGKRVGGSSESYGDICSADFQHRRLGYHPYADHCRYPGFQRPQTSIPRHEQSRPHRRPQRTYSDLGMPLDRALSDSELLMAGHRTDYCASLRHTIQDLIDSGAVSFPVSTTDTDLGPDVTADSFPACSTHAVPHPSGLYHHVLDTQGTDIHQTP